MVSTRRKKAVVSTKFIEDSNESDGNDAYQDEEYVSVFLFAVYSPNFIQVHLMHVMERMMTMWRRTKRQCQPLFLSNICLI